MEERSRRIEVMRKTDRRMLHILLNLLSGLVLISLLWIIENVELGSCVSAMYHSGSNANHQSVIQLANQYPLVQRCSNGAPLQWRPYLDVASKAHLAPNVVLGSLKYLNLAPIQLTSSGQQSGSLLIPLSQQQKQQQLVYHPQNINNIGVNVEATFIITKVLKRSIQSNYLRVAQTIKLVYKVSASLSTTQALMTLVNSSGSMMNSSDPNTPQNQALNSQSFYQNQRQQQQILPRSQQQQQQQQASPCSLELSELELVKKANKIFKMNQNYVLFLDQSSLLSQHYHSQHHPEVKHRVYSEINRNNQHQFQLKEQQLQEQQVGAAASPTYLNMPAYDAVSLHPFATHELLTNQTSRALRKILCKNCAQVPQIQLLNSTSVQDQQQQQQQQQQQSQAPNKIKLDCRVTGYPTPWIQWFRNGKLLRNKSGKLNIRTNKWKKRYNVRLSRLEIIQQVGKNDTGVYECRAMNVVSREPVVGAYTLLVLPTSYAIIPMQPSLVASTSDSNSSSSSNNNNNNSNYSNGGNGNNNVSSSNKINSNNNLAANETNLTIEINGKVEESRSKTNTSPPTASVTSTTPTAVAPTSNNSSISIGNGRTKGMSTADPNSILSTGPAVAAGQVPCPREVHDIFCLNKGTCVLIGNIAEYLCNCAEGYHGLRCEYKSSKLQKPNH